VIAAGIILERLWSLQRRRVIPTHLVAKVWSQLQHGMLDDEFIARVRSSSPLGLLLAAGLINRAAERAVMKENIEDTGRHVVHDLARYLNSLGTIAAISPLLGLLSTVVGLMKVFAALTTHGVGNPAALAGGISEALITTVAGLGVAIPAIVGYRYLRGKVDGLVVEMEQEVIKLIDAVHNQPHRIARARPGPQMAPGRPIPGATGATP
jgi:biopolymer transport protein ExbB